MEKLVGYVRVSTQDQEVHLQVDALAKAGYARNMIFIDKITGAKSERPGYNGLKKSDKNLLLYFPYGMVLKS